MDYMSFERRDKNMDEKEEELVKICLIGSVHPKLKTKFIRRFAEDKFSGNYLPTLGVDITTKKITFDDHSVKLILVDTAGQEFFGKLRPNYYRGASGVIILFDKGDYKSLTDVPNWLREFRENIEAKIPVTIKKKYYSNQPPPDPTPAAIVGLITETEEVTSKEAQALADQLRLKYFECLPTEGKELVKVIEYFIMKSIEEESEIQKKNEMT